MRRARLTLTLAAAAALLLAVAAPAAPAATATSDTHVSVHFKLRANNGLAARVENSESEVTLTIAGRHRVVEYAVKGTVSEEAVEAQFGGLGRIQVEFQPTRTLESSSPPPECEGEPWTTQAGVFVGTIEFSGPHRYATIDQTRAKGTMRVTPDWDCHGPRHPIVVHPSAASKAATEGDEATLSAVEGAHRRFFIALATRGSKGGSYTLLLGGTARRQGSMRILSAAVIAARSPTFVFDHASGTATVSPPPPFSGDATFERRPGGSSTWKGSLRVNLLDSQRPVALTGPGFRASLVREFPGD